MKTKLAIKIAIFYFFSAIMISNMVAQDISFAGNAETYISGYFPGTDKQGNFSTVYERVKGTLNASAGDCSLFVAGDTTCNILNISNGNNALSLNLKEAWFNWTSPAFANNLQFNIKLGRQINAWGKADQIKIADVLYAQDYTTLLTKNYLEARLGIDALKVSLLGEIFAADVYWVPVRTFSELPLDESSPIREAIVPKSVYREGYDVPIIVQDPTRPELSMENSSYATRVSFWLPSVDFSLYGYYGYDDMPVMSYELATLLVIPYISVSEKYYKYIMTGFDAAVPVGPLVFRAEGAFFFDRAFGRTAESMIVSGYDSYVKKNQMKALIGVDWMTNGWVITAQYYDDVIFGYDDNDYLDRKVHKPGTTLSVSKRLLSDTLTLTVSGLLNWNDFDSVLKSSVDYSLTDQIALTLGTTCYLAGPESKGENGAFKNLSNIYLKGVYSF